jgi:hypothetical protein
MSEVFDWCTSPQGAGRNTRNAIGSKSDDRLEK